MFACGMGLMLRVYKRLVELGDRNLAEEVASSLLAPLRDELRSIDRRECKDSWARKNEEMAEIMDELGRELIAMDNLKHAYDAWVELGDSSSACRCALKLAYLTYYADREKETVSWTDKVIEVGVDYATTVEAYRLQVRALRCLDRFGAAQDTLNYYRQHVERYSGGSRSEQAIHKMMSATVYFYIKDYEACLRTLAEWYELLDDKRRAKPFLDANTGVVLAGIGLHDQSRMMLKQAKALVEDDSYRPRYPNDYLDYRLHFGDFNPDDPDSIPGFMEYTSQS